MDHHCDHPFPGKISDQCLTFTIDLVGIMRNLCGSGTDYNIITSDGRKYMVQKVDMVGLIDYVCRFIPRGT